MKNLQDILADIKTNMTKFYVYLIRKPPTMMDEWTLLYPEGTPFYVGKGSDIRILVHEKQAKAYSGPAYPPPLGVNLHKIHTIQEIWHHGGKPLYDIEFYDTNEEAVRREKGLIAKIGRIDQGGPLTNLTEGGDGLVDPSPEVRRRIGRATKERLSDPENLRRHSQERRTYFKDPKNRLKHREAIRKAYEENPELRQHNRETQKEAQVKPDVAEKKSRAMKEYWSNPYWADKTQKAQRDGWTLEKSKAKSERNKRWYLENPERVQEIAKKRNETLRTPEYRERRSELTKRQIAEGNGELHRRSAEARRTPEFLEKRAAITRGYMNDPEVKQRAREGQRRAHEYRSAIRNRCIAIKEQYGLDVELPHHASAIKGWEAFENRLNAIVTRVKQER